MYSSRVYDSRTNETVFKGTSEECVQYLLTNYKEDDEDFSYVWLENFSTGQHTQINL